MERTDEKWKMMSQEKRNFILLFYIYILDLFFLPPLEWHCESQGDLSRQSSERQMLKSGN